MEKRKIIKTDILLTTLGFGGGPIGNYRSVISDKEAYITSTEEDPRIEVLLDSITITGATPSRKKCTVVNNQFINSI